jgi:uncharacterized membrane protein YtjA (UPF0391 family)
LSLWVSARGGELRLSLHVFGEEDMEFPMFAWAAAFLVLAIVAAYLGFFGLAGLAAVFVKLLFVVFLILLAGSGLLALIRDEPPL